MINIIQFLILKNLYKLNVKSASSSGGRLSLQKLLGDNFVDAVNDKLVIDYGCGHGEDIEQIAGWKAKLALGIEIREEIVKNNQARVQKSNCSFSTELPTELKSNADIVISIDAFEHFDAPEIILHNMKDCLKPNGQAYICFGPPWFHPRGGHLFSVFPWAHLLLSEKALMKWRNQYFHDGATKFGEVSGGLNKMTISRFQKMVKTSGFETEELDYKPIRGMKILQFILGKEFSTAFVVARLRKAA